MCINVCAFWWQLVCCARGYFWLGINSHPAHSVTWHWLHATMEICCLSRIFILPFPLTLLPPPPHTPPQLPSSHLTATSLNRWRKITPLLPLASPAPVQRSRFSSRSRRAEEERGRWMLTRTTVGIQVVCVCVCVAIWPLPAAAQCPSSVAEAAQAVLSLQRQHAAADGCQNIKTISS